MQIPCENYAIENNCVGVWGGRHRKLGEEQTVREIAPIVFLPTAAPVRIGPSPSSTGSDAPPSTPSIAARTGNQAQAI